MHCQFVRLNTYGAFAATMGRRRWHENAFDILDEAGRVSGAMPHIKHPSPPLLLCGDLPQNLKPCVETIYDFGRDNRGAPLRRSSPVLYGIVASYPVPWRELDAGINDANLIEWSQSVVSWLELTFGNNLGSAVLHLDEPYPHVHAFVIPPIGPLNRLDHTLHPGRKARKEALEGGADRIDGERAYRAGMRNFQDGYYEKVSKRFGHERTGPRRRRFQRDVALQRQATARVLDNLSMIIERATDRLSAGAYEANQKALNDLKVMATSIGAARLEHDRGRANSLSVLLADLSAANTDTTEPTPREDSRFEVQNFSDFAEEADGDHGPGNSEGVENDYEDDPGPEGNMDVEFTEDAADWEEDRYPALDNDIEEDDWP
ncbi:plasmid recombination protein [Devosia sp. Leaf64]|uniref:plasmid recombination protein n=1 Tax=Devosia sp. Leaf64 TaxID=1736229 RepID=UPI000B17E94C|nr:plasmid recombination protein [Devosia sp. Leaf64]